MDRDRGRQYWTVLAAMVCGLTFLTSARAGDSGELFPNVAPYDETVSSPISKPEKVIQKPQPAPAPVAPVTPVPNPAPVTPNPAPVKNPPDVEPGNPVPDPGADPRPIRRHPKRPPSETQPSTAPAPPPPPPLIDVMPFAAGLLTPMLSPADQEAFNAQYGDALTKALAGSVELRKKTAETFETAAQTAPSPAFKRFLLLDAFAMYIRASTPLLERVQKAETLLPLLSERTLPVVQARADALNDLMLTATSNPNERFLDLFIEAHATLAKLQVQAGFPRDAQESLKKAREASLHYMHKSQARMDQINEAAAWCDRSTAAAAMWPKFQGVLKASPEDSYTNNMMATLHLSLYGNLGSAAVFAAKSDRKDLKAFAQVVKSNPPQALSTDPAQHAQQVMAIAAAMIEVAKATSVAQPFDRYSIACYAGDHVDMMLSAGAVPADKIPQAQALIAAAKEIVDKTNLRRGDDLPRWLESPGAVAAKPKTPGTPAPARSIGGLADVFRGLPRELTPTEMGWSSKQLEATNQWLAKNVDGLVFEGDAYPDEMESPIDGPDGKIYVPGIFALPVAALNQNVGISTRIELRMTIKMAAKAKGLGREQATTIKGTIMSAHVYNFEAGHAQLELVVVNKSE